MPLFTPRNLGTIDFVADQQKTMMIDRDGVLLQLNLRLQYTVTSDSSAMVGPKFETLSRLIKRLEIVMGGRDTVLSLDGPGLVRRAMDDFGVRPQGTGDTFVLTGSSTATSYDMVIPVVFWSPRGRRPQDTALDLRKVRQATLRIQWGDIDDLVTTVNAAVISGVTCTVEGQYMLDVADTDAFLVRQLDMLEEELTGSNENFTILLDSQTGLLMRSALLVTTANDVAVDTIIGGGNIRVESGSFVFKNQNGRMLQGDNTLMYNLQQDTGVYDLPFLKFGEGVNLVNTGALTANLNLKLDATKVTGTNVIKVYRESWRPLKVDNAA